MLRDIAERDWKVFRQLHDVALERFCERVLADVSGILADSPNSAHKRYLALFKLMKQRDRQLAMAFDDMRRSAALKQLLLIQSHGLLTDEEFARFSSETRAIVQSWMELRERR